jgi:hypothetical protein
VARKMIQLLATVVLLALALATSAAPAHATGICTGSITLTPDINPTYDYLAMFWQAAGATNCTQPLYRFVFWNGVAGEIFRDYTTAASAYWDTHNLVGTQYVMVYVKDATSPYTYDTYSPWYTITSNSHQGEDTWDSRQQKLFLQNIDPQGHPLDSNGNKTVALITDINFLPASNASAANGTPQCQSSGPIYEWQGAYVVGVPGGGPNYYAFAQPGTDYGCVGNSSLVFGVMVTTEQINCPLGGAANFGAPDDSILPNGSGVTASASLEYKGCFVATGTVGMSPGQDVPYEMYAPSGSFGMYANGQLIFWAASSAAGIDDPWLDTEINSMSSTSCGYCPEAPGIGDNVNNGQLVANETEASFYYDDITDQWPQLPHDTANDAYPYWFTSVVASNGSIDGPDLYCDRPYGYYGGWLANYPSSYVFQTNLHGAC